MKAVSCPSLAALLAAAALSGCAPEPPSLDELSRRGYRDLEEGRPDQALAAAAQGRRQAREHGAEAWIRSFKVLEAEALVSQRRNAEALRLLDRATAPAAPTDAVGTRALMTRALALCRSASPSREAAADFEGASRAAPGAAVQPTGRRGRVAPGILPLPPRALERRRGGLPLHAPGTPAARGRNCWRHTRPAASAWCWCGRGATTKPRTGSAGAAARLGARGGAGAPLKIMINAGWCDYLLGEYERARETLRQAVDMAAARGLAGDRLVALTNLGNTHYKLGEPARAAEDYAQALRLPGSLSSGADEALLLANLGVVALEEGRYDAAAAHVAQALPITRELKDEAGQQLCAFTEAEIAAARGDDEGALARYKDLIADPRTPEEMLWEVQAALARAHVRAGRNGAAEAEFGRAFTTMDRVRSSLSEVDRRITFSSSLRRFQDDYVDFLVSSGKQEQALLVADRGDAGACRKAWRPKAPPRRAWPRSRGCEPWPTAPAPPSSHTGSRPAVVRLGGDARRPGDASPPRGVGLAARHRGLPGGHVEGPRPSGRGAAAGRTPLAGPRTGAGGSP